MQKIRLEQNIYRANQKKYKKNSVPSFKGNVSTAKEVTDTFMHKKMGFRGWLTNFFNTTKGEVQNQLGTALFTTTLAPAMIAFNPFSKQDKETKEYSAMRQPVSAAVALGVSLPLTMAYEKWMKKMALNGDINAIDLRIMKPESEYEKEFKKYSKTEGANAKYQTLDKYAEAKNKEMIESFAEKYIYSDANTVLENAKKDLEAGKISKQEFKKLKSTIETHNLNKQKFSDFMKDEFKFKFIKSQGQNFLNVEDYTKKLDEIKAIDFLNRLGLVDAKTTEEELRIFLLEQKQKNYAIEIAKEKGIPINSKEFEEILKDLKANNKLASRNIEYFLGPIKDKKISLGQLLEIFDMEKTFKGDLDNSLIEEIKTELEKIGIKNNADDLFLTKESNTMKSVIENLKKKLSGLKDIDKKGIKDIALEIAKNKGKNAITDFSHIKNYTSIGFNLVLTAISCTVLNWIYPRFMDAFFPKLSAAKKQGGKK